MSFNNIITGAMVPEDPDEAEKFWRGLFKAHGYDVPEDENEEE